MSKVVLCQVLKREAPALQRPPHPGDLGQRIYENVSKEGWQQWLERLTMIINEYGLSTADPKALEMIEAHMLGFLFKEGEFGSPDKAFAPPQAKK